MALVINGNPAPPPFAPTLVTPANASYQNPTTPTFSWTYNPAQMGKTQTGWAMRRKLVTSGTYQWWNLSTTSWQGTFILNTSTVQTYTFSSGAWTGGNQYNWSVLTADSNGTGSAAPDDTVSMQVGPVVSVANPAATIADASPPVGWTTSFGAGATMSSYRVAIYNAAQYGAGGFTPGSGASVFDSGIVPATNVSTLLLAGQSPPVVLLDSTSYRVYVWVTETGGMLGSAFAAFTTSFLEPATPLVTGVPGFDGVTGAPVTTITVTGQDGGSTAAYVGLGTANVTFSDDGGTTWWPLRNGTAVPLPSVGQQAVILDYEAPPGFVRLYAAQITVVS